MSYLAQNLKVHAGFPGGNIIVEEYRGDSVLIRHDMSMCDGWWFWWYFEAVNTADEPYRVRFEFTEGSPIGIAGPCVCINGGAWHWLGRECVDNNTFEFRFSPEMKTCRFAFSIPYLESDLQQFLSSHPAIQVTALAKTLESRRVELLHIPSETGRFALYFTARHHACEAMADYVLEGIMAERLENPVLRRNADFYLVPFMDKDGVENGDQGKNRPPHDHNRDYGHFLYEATSAFVKLLSEHRERNFLALDIHCPFMNDDKLFFVEPPDTAGLQRFREAFLACHTGGVPYQASDDLQYNSGWNDATLENSCSGYILREGLIRLAFSMEVPYAEARGLRITEERARMLGRDLARAAACLIEQELKS